LDAVITASGKVQVVEVRRDFACLTQVAVQAVEAWKFSPATLAGKPIVSRMPVAVTFRPPSALASPLTLPELKPQTDAAIQAEFQPAEVLRAALPEYRGDATAAGTVVLEVILSPKGEADDVKVVRDLAPFTAEAKAVVGDWRFMPATLNGVPVPSKIVLAFVSSPPLAPVP
jgi:outer membrane biosynthesis protein TonB